MEFNIKDDGNMKKLFGTLLVLVFTILLISPTNNVEAIDTTNTIVYFYSDYCDGCRALKGLDSYNNYTEEEDYIKKIEDAGFTIIYMDTNESGPSTVIPPNVTFEGDTPTVSDIWTAFSIFYEVEGGQHTPQLFVGDTYYGEEELRTAYNNGEFQLKAQMSLLDVDVTAGENYQNIQGFLGFLGVLGAGLLDGFNPCAIALLLLFISLLGFTENKRVLIIVSVTYIFTMFISYFLIGLGVLAVLEEYVKQTNLALYVSWVIFILVLIFFILNIYDFFMSKNEDYGKIVNQLPKWVQKMNKRIMKTFTNAMNDTGNKGNIFAVIGLTLLLGLTMSLTEFLCTGQIYTAILDGISVFRDFYAYVALFFYNVMFVLPMIIIAVFSVKSGSVMKSSNWIREHMHIIKLLNSLLFLGIAIYYAFRLFG